MIGIVLIVWGLTTLSFLLGVAIARSGNEHKEKQ